MTTASTPWTRRLLARLAPELPRLLAGAACLALGGALMGLVVSTVKPLVNRVFLRIDEPSSSDSWIDRLPLDGLGPWVEREAFVQVPLVLVGIFVLRGVLMFFGQSLTMTAGVRFVRRVRIELFDAVASQSLRFFNERPSGVILSRVLQDSQQVQRIATGILSDAVRVGAMVPFLALTAILHEARLALVAAIALPLLGYPTIRLGRRLRIASKRSLEGLGELARRVTELTAGIDVVQSHGNRAGEVERFRQATDVLMVQERRAIRARAIAPSVMEILGAVIGAFLFGAAGREVAANRLELGDFSVVVLCLGLLFMSLRRLSGLYADVQQSRAAAERVLEWVDLQPEIRDAPDAQPAPPFSDALRFEGVSFAHEVDPVLDGVDFELKRGEVVALVGASGSGKSTLSRLMPRFYDPDEGRVTFDGHDLRGLQLDSFRSQIGIVPQEPVLFDDTVRANVTYGTAVDEVRLAAALEAAQAASFVAELTSGLETVLGERGVRLSAGQRQRLAIARALYRDAPILILDEATSALDAKSEAALAKALEQLLAGRTCLIIAHRLVTARRADRIVVLDRGRIVESGAPEELLARRGRYWELEQAQQRGETL